MFLHPSSTSWSCPTQTDSILAINSDWGLSYITVSTLSNGGEASYFSTYDKWIKVGECVVLAEVAIMKKEKLAIMSDVTNFLSSEFEYAGPFAR
jgi:hypothetical protein